MQSRRGVVTQSFGAVQSGRGVVKCSDGAVTGSRGAVTKGLGAGNCLDDAVKGDGGTEEWRRRIVKGNHGTGNRLDFAEKGTRRAATDLRREMGDARWAALQIDGPKLIRMAMLITGRQWIVNLFLNKFARG